ncbi:hypothetical protein [Mycobacterium malmoense]|uniref:hypothetical protein n=1 Tax=Mycobacterium malmoense TaxID=1780 RepID=UPI000AC97C3D|nr:hypothetical protein [Mycobacterium malmoense]
MDLAARPHITAGVALASAAVLAAGPMARHLPDLRLAQHLPIVSVSAARLTDAASSMVDLFAGVENELASLANGASAAAVPAAALTDFINPAALPLPLATWVNTFQQLGTDLQTIVGTVQQLPVPILQQTAANWASYGDLYVSTWQKVATSAVTFYTGTKSTQFWGLLNTAFNDYASGKISTGLTTLYDALYQTPVLNFGEPLEAILKIPAYFTQNLANATNYLTTTAVANLGNDLLIAPANALRVAIGGSFQAASSAWAGGDPVGAIGNLLDTPGEATKALLNSLLNTVNVNLLQDVVPGLANSIVAPGAVNIAAGGSLQAALQSFANQLVNGWPSLSNAVSGISTGLITLLQNVSSKMPSLMASFGATLATNIGLLISNLLKLL